MAETVKEAPDEMIRAICAERCGSVGDPPCYTLPGLEWDGGKCNSHRDLDCAAIASVAYAALPDGDMAAFGAADAACIHYPHEDQQAERTAFCDGAAMALSRLPDLPQVEGESEPVAWIIDHGGKGRGKRVKAVLRSEYDVREPAFWKDGAPPEHYTITPLYALPTPPRG